MKNRKPLRRIAWVRFSPNGSSYPTACPRSDLGAGDEVDVWMRAGQPDEHYLQGIITAVRRERWQCSCRTVNLASEVEYGWVVDEASGEITFERRVLEAASTQNDDDWDDLEEDDEHSLSELYEAMGEGNGAPLYLNDGMWLSARGRVYED